MAAFFSMLQYYVAEAAIALMLCLLHSSHQHAQSVTGKACHSARLGTASGLKPGTVQNHDTPALGAFYNPGVRVRGADRW